MKYVLICLILTGCATTRPIQIDQETESSAAIGSVSILRSIGKAFLRLIGNVQITVEVKQSQQDK